jgi:hypothetical protein
VAFEGNLTLTAAPVTFEGAAFFANGVVVTLSNTSSAIKLSGKTGALAVGTPVANVPDIYSTVLIGNDAGTGGTLAAGTANGATLTFATTGITQDAPAANDHGITITGKVAAIPLKSYTVASASSKVGTLTVDTGAVLTLDAGTLAPYNSYATGLESDWTAKLVLTGAATANGALLKGAGSVVAGGTTIVGGTNGWQAATGSANVTIAKDAINVASGGTLTAQDADAAITVTASRLAVTGEIVLASGKGKLILKGDDTTAGSLLLKGHASNAGKLRVAVDSSTVKVGATVTNSTFLIFAASGMSATTQAYVTAADGTKVTPANLSVNGGNTDASSGTTLSSINAGNEADTKDVLITGQTAEANALTIISGAYVKVTNSDA